MDRCANTEALNRYLSGEEQAEEALDAFESDIEDILEAIREAVKSIMYVARDYQHGNGSYDFEDIAKDIIKENI